MKSGPSLALYSNYITGSQLTSAGNYQKQTFNAFRKMLFSICHGPDQPAVASPMLDSFAVWTWRAEHLLL